jgi:hypothetical protein
MASIDGAHLLSQVILVPNSPARFMVTVHLEEGPAQDGCLNATAVPKTW